MKLTNIEKETIILFNEVEKKAEIYTFNYKLKKKIKAANEKNPEIFVIKREDENGALTCELPKNRLSIRLLPPINKERYQKQVDRMTQLHKEGRFHPMYNGASDTENTF